MKSKDFGNGEGELDMLFGFFVMNGACIVFFLLFGVCVICNCAARKPKFHGSEEKKRKKPTVSRLVQAFAPTGMRFKAANNVGGEAGQNANVPLLQPNSTTASTGSRRGSAASITIRLDQNSNHQPNIISHEGGGGAASGPMIANHSPAHRSFKSLVAKAMMSPKFKADALNGDADGGGDSSERGTNCANVQQRTAPTAAAGTTASPTRQSRQSGGALSGGNSPTRRMSILENTTGTTATAFNNGASRRVSKLSHCSTNEQQQWLETAAVCRKTTKTAAASNVANDVPLKSNNSNGKMPSSLDVEKQEEEADEQQPEEEEVIFL